MLISQGLVGPKEMGKPVSDGQTVNIPLLLVNVMGGRRAVCPAYYWIYVHCIGMGLQENPGPGLNAVIRVP
ncbi:hypothetical protein COW82_02860 [Candidatus Campbellbacteria bacterium CG22_combo_CG10-13_8_21_14_all_43_18]|uniref:Uncharacterized protein n=1 Tax=Candidatus Campbellbacteria bacterium CG22_combo_CG10-13_8_21_14_all_43_18 TaxID=1974530 RepID=A0A2H0DWP8_9BACT|nr:MAG: hypothetical protein COW82_02860 [Candidatus Campbellbacteria bacterium CG22_combo_CG10-13_8_21_14_all_43_18]